MFFFLQVLTILHTLFMMSNHPLFMGFILMLSSITYGLMMYFYMTTPWVTYILIMIFISGAMIMYIYMASLSSNENMKTDLVKTLKLFFISSLILMLMMINAKNNILPAFNEMNMSQLKETTENIYKTYNELMMDMTMMMITYLLMVLIVAMKIISFKKGPLRI